MHVTDMIEVVTVGAELESSTLDVTVQEEIDITSGTGIHVATKDSITAISQDVEIMATKLEVITLEQIKLACADFVIDSADESINVVMKEEMQIGVDHMWVNSDGTMYTRAGRDFDLVVNHDAVVSVGDNLQVFATDGIDLLSSNLTAAVGNL